MLFSCFSSVSPSYPGQILQEGSYGSEVARMQKYLDGLRITKYTQLPNLSIDGAYGASTKQAVTTYQTIKNLSVDGIIGENTWDDIVKEYNNTIGGSEDTYPGIPIVFGMTGEDVTLMQQYLNSLVNPYTAINSQNVDGNFGSNMSDATTRFQKQFGLSGDAEIGNMTWNKIVEVQEKQQKVSTPYPGYSISVGDSGDDVRFIQSYVNATRTLNITVDGVFGDTTKQAIIEFQTQYGLKVDGIVGNDTWCELVKLFNKTV